MEHVQRMQVSFLGSSELQEPVWAQNSLSGIILLHLENSMVIFSLIPKHLSNFSVACHCQNAAWEEDWEEG